MRVTLAEEIMLLSLDDESGQAKDRWTVGWIVAGGLLLELALAERVRVDGNRVEVVDTSSTGDALLDDRLEAIAAWAGSARAATVAAWLRKDQLKSIEATLAGLCARGIVTEERHRALGLFPVRRFPEADGTVERELRERLNRVVLEDAEPDLRTAGLIGLLHGARLHRLAFPGEPRKRVEPRMAAVAEGQWAAEAVQDTIRATQVAIMAATAAASAAAAAAAVS
ncbi:Golgi phosphoprotein 3 (GPP34) [Streptomyces sp. TLI_053]|uniref:GOLPH3/VPS74 family protein n=1 Tax=Streptomyces sp. TLI_053 TaxID=1855352 RepID=UPI00087A724D|nr:GPP34 family phosphoprotein [Streptomyces sp. TLI_053]SDT82662.1 Golgi phosphoprotein 3 (GPP34) [Streptomyces sp. TLI_053]